MTAALAAVRHAACAPRAALRTAPFAALACALHQSGQLLGADTVNASLSDAVAVLLAVILVARTTLRPRAVHLFVFLGLCAVQVLVAGFVTPARFGVPMAGASIVANLAKNVLLLVFFLLGCHLAVRARTGALMRFFAAYAWAAVAIGVVGGFAVLLRVEPLCAVLAYGGDRLRGLMADPNYFAVMQVMAVPYFARARALRGGVRTLALAVLAASVLLSSSRTGLICLLACGALIAASAVWRAHGAGGLRLGRLSLRACAGAGAAVVLLALLGEPLAAWLHAQLPVTERLGFAFSDASAIAGSRESTRSLAWGVAVDVAAHAPLVGVGRGAYLPVAAAVAGVSVLPHNTYLTILAEWGAPALMLAAVLLGALAVRASGRSATAEHLIARDMLVVLLVAFMGLSLDNARILWLALGVLCALPSTIRWGCAQAGARRGAHACVRGGGRPLAGRG